MGVCRPHPPQDPLFRPSSSSTLSSSWSYFIHEFSFIQLWPRPSPSPLPHGLLPTPPSPYISIPPLFHHSSRHLPLRVLLLKTFLNTGTECLALLSMGTFCFLPSTFLPPPGHLSPSSSFFLHPSLSVFNRPSPSLTALFPGLLWIHSARFYSPIRRFYCKFPNNRNSMPDYATCVCEFCLF